MKKILNSITSDKHYNKYMSIFAIIFAFLLASIILLFSGLSPILALKMIFKGITGLDLSKIGRAGFFNPRTLGEYGVTLMPLILTGLSVAFAFRTGLFNIGAEGQVMMGSLASVAVAILFNLPKIIHLPLAIIAGFLAGALWGGIPGYLKSKFKVHEVVVCIMLNYVGLSLSGLLMSKLPNFENMKTPAVPTSASLKSEFLSNISQHSRFHWGFIIVVISIILFHYIIEKTKFGYELRAVGNSQDAARYAGIKVEKSIVFSMMISGGFAGLAGTVLSLGTFGYGRYLVAFDGYGFTGIAVALAGGNTAIGTLFSALVFGGLSNSGRLLQIKKIPRDITMMISALIILFIAMKEGFRDLFKNLLKSDLTKGEK